MGVSAVRLVCIRMGQGYFHTLGDALKYAFHIQVRSLALNHRRFGNNISNLLNGQVACPYISMHRIATSSTKVLVVALVQNYKNRKMRCEPSLSQHDAYRYKRLQFCCSEETLGLEVVYPHAMHDAVLWGFPFETQGNLLPSHVRDRGTLLWLSHPLGVEAVCQHRQVNWGRLTVFCRHVFSNTSVGLCPKNLPASITEAALALRYKYVLPLTSCLSPSSLFRFLLIL